MALPELLGHEWAIEVQHNAEAEVALCKHNPLELAKGIGLVRAPTRIETRMRKDLNRVKDRTPSQSKIRGISSIVSVIFTIN